MASAAVSTVTLGTALGSPRYHLGADAGKQVGSATEPQLLTCWMCRPKPPRATSIHAWAEVDEDGDLISEDFHRCLTIARDSGFDGPIMLQSGYPVDIFQRSREVWTRVDEMRDELRNVFKDALQEGT